MPNNMLNIFHLWGLYQKSSRFRSVAPELEDLWLSSQHNQTGAEKKWADCGLSNNVSLPHVVIDQRDNQQWQRIKINTENQLVLTDAIKFESNDEWNLKKKKSFEVDSSQLSAGSFSDGQSFLTIGLQHLKPYAKVFDVKFHNMISKCSL